MLFINNQNQRRYHRSTPERPAQPDDRRRIPGKNPRARNGVMIFLHTTPDQRSAPSLQDRPPPLHHWRQVKCRNNGQQACKQRQTFRSVFRPVQSVTDRQHQQPGNAVTGAGQRPPQGHRRMAAAHHAPPTARFTVSTCAATAKPETGIFPSYQGKPAR